MQPPTSNPVPPEPSGSFQWVQAPWGLVLESIALSAVAPHFFTARTSPVNDANGATNWTEIASTIGVSPDHLWRFNQYTAATSSGYPPAACRRVRRLVRMPA